MSTDALLKICRLLLHIHTIGLNVIYTGNATFHTLQREVDQSREVVSQVVNSVKGRLTFFMWKFRQSLSLHAVMDF